MPLINVYNYLGTKLEPAFLRGPSAPDQLAARFPVSVTIPAGTLVGELTAAPGTYAPYDHTEGDGTQVLKGITVYEVVTNADGLVTNLGGPAYGLDETAPIYVNGYFRCEDIDNASELDDAIAAGACKLVQGTATTGIFALVSG